MGRERSAGTATFNILILAFFVITVLPWVRGNADSAGGCDPGRYPKEAISVSTFAGTPPGGATGSQSSYTDGAAESATFNTIKGLALSPDGDWLFVSERYRVRKVNAATGFTTYLAGGITNGFESGDGTTALFDNIRGLAVSPSGQWLYAVDSHNHVLRRVDANSGYTSNIAGRGTYGSRVGGGTVSFSYPLDVVTTTDGLTLYMAGHDKYLWKIRESDGESEIVASGFWSNPPPNDIRGLTISPDNKFIYIAGWRDHIYKISTDDYSWTRLVDLVDYGDTNTVVAYFRGVSRSLDGAWLYISDTLSHKVWKVNTTSGDMETLAGTGVAGHVDGPGISAQISSPWGLEVSPDGRYLYVGDGGNKRVRRITFNQTCVTCQSDLPASASPIPVSGAQYVAGCSWSCLIGKYKDSGTSCADCPNKWTSLMGSTSPDDCFPQALPIGDVFSSVDSERSLWYEVSVLSQAFELMSENFRIMTDTFFLESGFYYYEMGSLRCWNSSSLNIDYKLCFDIRGGPLVMN